MTTEEAKTWDVVVIGGGPAGMMAAARAAERGRSVLLLEKNARLGKKLSITGGGRCNVTNHRPEVRTMLAQYKDDAKFLFSTFTQHGVRESMDWFTNRGVTLKEENDGRLFPTTDSAETICQALEDELAQRAVTVRRSASVSDIQFDSATERFGIRLSDGSSLATRACILATGGESRPETGSTGEGFAWLTALGHTIRRNDYALVPLRLQESWVSRVSGVVLEGVKIIVYADSERRSTHSGRVLFTHVGVSGPTILNLSREVGDWLQYSDVVLRLDLFPSHDEGSLRNLLNEQFAATPNRTVRNILSTLLPRALVTVLLEELAIGPDTPAHSLRKEERAVLVQRVKALPLTVAGLAGADKAVIANGGVQLPEVNFKTMESRVVPGLFIVGDLLDIDRPSGGYSLQLCWSTGYVAGSHA